MSDQNGHVPSQEKIANLSVLLFHLHLHQAADHRPVVSDEVHVVQDIVFADGPRPFLAVQVDCEEGGLCRHVLETWSELFHANVEGSAGDRSRPDPRSLRKDLYTPILPYLHWDVCTFQNQRVLVERAEAY